MFVTLLLKFKNDSLKTWLFNCNCLAINIHLNNKKVVKVANWLLIVCHNFRNNTFLLQLMENYDIISIIFIVGYSWAF